MTRMRSNYLNKNIVLYDSKLKPGYVYKFFFDRGNEYRCCRCKEFGKTRCIRVVDDVVIGRKDPEVDHHPDCQPLSKDVVAAQQCDRDMRNEVCFVESLDIPECNSGNFNIGLRYVYKAHSFTISCAAFIATRGRKFF